MQNQVDAESCKIVLDAVLKPKVKGKGSNDIRDDFLDLLESPVDKSNAAYYVVVTKPVTLVDIRAMLENPLPSFNPVEFAIAFRRMVSNFFKFNWVKDMWQYRQHAKKLLQIFEEEFEKVFPQQYSVSLFSTTDNLLFTVFVIGTSASIPYFDFI